MYKIHVDYETGDSFGHEDTYTVLPFVWKNVDIAKENLKRIREHYEYYKAKNKVQYGKRIDTNVIKPKYCDAKYEFSFSLLLDDGTESENICASWCGYFETLYGAKIISDPEDGWSFTL